MRILFPSGKCSGNVKSGTAGAIVSMEANLRPELAGRGNNGTN